MKDLRLMVGGLALAAFSGLALACPPDCDQACCVGAGDDSVEVSFGEPGDDENTQSEWIAVLNRSGVNALGDTDEERVEIRVIKDEDGALKIFRNGKELSEDEYRRDSGHIALLSEDGEHEPILINLDPEGGAQFMLKGDDDGDGDNDQVGFFNPSTPPVMVGITMGEPDEALRAQLGLGDRPAFMIEDVLEGLPADQAGLKKYDIVIAIDGDDDDISQEKLHDVLMNKKPGDELKFRVIRGGEKETVRVKLAAYSARDLMNDEEVVVSELGGVPGELHTDKLAELTEQLRGAGLDEDQVEELEQQLEEAMKQSQAQGWRGQGRFPGGNFTITPRVDRDGTIMMVPGQKNGRMFELHVPGAPDVDVPEPMRRQIEVQRQGSNDLEQRMEALERRMDEVSGQLEERMGRMMDRFEKLADRLEKRLDDH